MTKKLLLIVSGSIAAIKVPALIELLRQRGISVTCILTKGGSNFVQPEELGAPVHTDLFSENKEGWMEHINLSRNHDLIAVIPASADIIARIAMGRADDLATATILASDKPVYIAPAMNTKMWENPATQANLKTIQANGIRIIEPESGMLACGEEGLGRLANIETLAAEIEAFWDKPLAGKKVVVTAGATYEPIDPVRFIGNRSTGLQGFAIAEVMRDAGADVVLVKGATTAPVPYGVKIVQAETAKEMLTESLNALPADIFIAAAAVADWRPESASIQKMKKRESEEPPIIKLVPNPDILMRIASLPCHPEQSEGSKILRYTQNDTMLQGGGYTRPKLVIGFAAETENLEENAAAKLRRKNADWIIANIVGANKGFGDVENEILFISGQGTEKWDSLDKQHIARKILEKILFSAI
jgi:phosphopantothenoylcysteine decarboxylase / phosphopantothenate---cysteine ligase